MSSRNVNIAVEQAAIQEVDRQGVAAHDARDVEAFLGFLTDDARMLPPNEPTLEGKPAIREMLEELYALPDFSVIHHPADRIVVSQSGDLAYISYAFELTVPGGEGGSVIEKGKDISIYQKQSDGNWKLAIDMFSSNYPE
ncbi:MAG: DUF4440 domain-containing protein [Dehalococcoidia bacterium]|jgi:uncharacterized protein (TIGR02246 family)|nr:DUF4440 domain-containing protein [Dehalococcoidia bacterium]